MGGGENSGGGVGDHMATLMTSVAAGQDRAAFQALFEHFAPRLKSFMHRQGTDPDMVEEILQETMVNVWRKAQQFDPVKASVSTWIFTIARNLRIDHLRKAKRPVPDMNDPALVPDPDPRPHEIISREQEASRLRDAVAGLPAEQQEVLRLAFFEEKTHQVVAQELGIPLGTVKSRIRLALQRIRAELGENR
jgi:RNA polymerase sigma-70 factor (ECF subfamily)